MTATLSSNPGKLSLDIDGNAAHAKPGIGHLRKPHSGFFEKTDVTPLGADHCLVVGNPHDAAHGGVRHVAEEGVATMQHHWAGGVGLLLLAGQPPFAF